MTSTIRDTITSENDRLDADAAAEATHREVREARKRVADLQAAQTIFGEQDNPLRALFPTVSFQVLAGLETDTGEVWMIAKPTSENEPPLHFRLCRRIESTPTLAYRGPDAPVVDGPVTRWTLSVVMPYLVLGSGPLPEQLPRDPYNLLNARSGDTCQINLDDHDQAMRTLQVMLESYDKFGTRKLNGVGGLVLPYAAKGVVTTTNPTPPPARPVYRTGGIIPSGSLFTIGEQGPMLMTKPASETPSATASEPVADTPEQ